MCTYWMQMQFMVQENEGMKIVSLEFSRSPVTFLLLYLVSRCSLNLFADYRWVICQQQKRENMKY